MFPGPGFLLLSSATFPASLVGIASTEAGLCVICKDPDETCQGPAFYCISLFPQNVRDGRTVSDQELRQDNGELDFLNSDLEFAKAKMT